MWKEINILSVVSAHNIRQVLLAGKKTTCICICDFNEMLSSIKGIEIAIKVTIAGLLKYDAIKCPLENFKTINLKFPVW